MTYNERVVNTNILVQKFGGTSVSTAERRNMAVSKVVDAIEQGFMPVVVVSAIGRSGDPYATDTLINFAKSIYKDIPKRELDILMSCGEIISSVIFANTLISRGYKSKVFTGGQAGIITDDNFGDAEIIRVEPQYILDALNQNIIPVVAGFQGITVDGDVTTLGRGGSDTTAALLGEALKAYAVEIYTDVDGIMTADPRIVANAHILKRISYNEVFQLAEQGAKVIHPRAVEIAMRGNIPLIIKNTMTDSPGTIITQYNNVYNNIYESDNLVTGIANMNNRVQIIMDLDKDDKDIFGKIAEAKISIDLINVFPDKKIFTISEFDLAKLEQLLNENQIKYEKRKNCSKVSIIGNRIRGVPGVMARIIKSLSENGIEIYQTADSHNTISCLVSQDKADKAVKVLHDEFKLENYN
ncbi:aspartate kinase [Thermoanaerobacterium thermosaccharolyticum]|jgi:aspartate kinase|uniref:Aspartokinase n=2 Tax=Thermoanaerobacterium thermosaccharolyticum TaxID=1517 RepID=D9TLQ0_THETC|nr:aspartate kinase [Thermoanaerobacterium thermosaccharolyticum]TCW38635.1 aspartate kinase [Thermohydrogenium kirishiense]ADL68912.1 aspartate kinase [Thermoanaerobacterium thermosaccharolyticum DSM 571]AST59046.1 aspartate kinase [Thermoanaerobacterium thermosaccharolyticum]KAA5807722.1 aspartate kinase [Thermoanaerobacterium thermosaccharolyticum]MBE0068072.1 aspartate kinase [Thermoanaerobacterium thermosaccharolyticum]